MSTKLAEGILYFHDEAVKAGFTEAQTEFLMAMLMTREVDEEPHCATCGSSNVETVEAEFLTGVRAPDGSEERRYEVATRCKSCGAIE
jgi:hypothetical protein